jgi:hypothetical protein
MRLTTITFEQADLPKCNARLRPPWGDAWGLASCVLPWGHPGTHSPSVNVVGWPSESVQDPPGKETT